MKDPKGALVASEETYMISFIVLLQEKVTKIWEGSFYSFGPSIRYIPL